VKFICIETGQDISGPLKPGLVNPSDTTIGTVTYNWTVNIGTANSASFTIGIVVESYYCRTSSFDYTVVTISKPVADFVTGGGYLLLESPAGVKSGDKGSRNNFGFNVKYNKSVTNLQGSINTIVRHKEGDGFEHVYQIKGNAMTSLAINFTITSVHPYPTAIFDGKASIQDVTDPLNVISVDGNASLHVEMTDKGEPGTFDMIAITVWNKDGGLWFASHWDINKTAEQQLAAGNLKVSGASSEPVNPGTTTTILTSTQNPSQVGQTVTFTAVVSKAGSNVNTPTGKITFYDGNTILKALSLTTVNGVSSASFAISKLLVGTHTITAGYSGDRNFTSSASTLIQIVNALTINRKMMPQTLEVTAYPNPSAGDFNLVIKSNSDKPVNIRVIDVWGRVIEQRGEVVPNNIVTVGQLYRPGTYFAEVRQEKKKVSVQLIKQPD
jgi:hypothetical protein